MAKTTQRERPARRGESGPQREHVDEETGIVIVTHGVDADVPRDQVDAAHEGFRHDFETRDSAGREYAQLLGKRDHEQHARDTKGRAR